MDVRKCDNCHHEWEGDHEHCAWCDSEFSTKIGEVNWGPVFDMHKRIDEIRKNHQEKRNGKEGKKED